MDHDEPPSFCPAIPCFFKNSPEAILLVFYSQCKLPNFWWEKIERKNPGGLLAAATSFVGRKFMSFGNFSKIK
jgi:hypothetical protein